MKKLIILCTLTLIFFIGLVSAVNLEDIGFNVSSELKPAEGDGLYFEDANNNSFKICEYDINNLKKELKDPNSGYELYNETIYMHNSSGGGNSIEVKNEEIGKMPTYNLFWCGECIKIDGKTYLVEVYMYDMFNPDYDACLNYLSYFNEHNSAEVVNLSNL